MASLKIAFVTARYQPKITADDQLIVDELLRLDAQVESAPWDDASVEWKKFSAIVIRSCWDYHHRPKEFAAWLTSMKQINAPIFNPLSVIIWNMHKQYLFELQSKGIAIPSGKLIRQHSPVSLRNEMEENRWERIVAKPAISATAKDTFVVAKDSMGDAQQKFEKCIAEGDMIIQEFMPEISDQGEVSMIFIDKQYSHAVLKKPKQNDFRVQNDFGGTAKAFEPTSEIIAHGEKILNAVKEPLLYTRVDGVISNGEFLLMELELIEPVLFFKESAAAAANLAKVLVASLR